MQTVVCRARRCISRPLGTSLSCKKRACAFTHPWASIISKAKRGNIMANGYASVFSASEVSMQKVPDVMFCLAAHQRLRHWPIGPQRRKQSIHALFPRPLQQWHRSDTIASSSTRTAVTLHAQNHIPDEPATLTSEQLTVVTLALEGASIFIGGNAGTGKSFVLCEVIKQLRAAGCRVAVTASTGMAALNIGGNTFHSTFGVPVNSLDCEHQASSAAHRRISYGAKVLSQTDVIVVDEVSMLHAGFLEALDHSARRARPRWRSTPFGGIQVILSGDFMQLSPFNGDQYSRSGSDRTDRMACRGVEKPESEGTQMVGQVLFPPSASVSRSGATSLQKRRGMGDRYSTGKQRPIEFYCHEPMYRSYVFNVHILALQLREPARHRGDAAFLADLNCLRNGILTHRLSRAAVTHPEDPAAVRIFATRKRVSAFNDRMLRSLGGEEQVFRTRLSLSSAGLKSQEAFINTAGERQPTAGLWWSETLLLHCYEPHRCPRTQRGTISRTDATALVNHFCGILNVPPKENHNRSFSLVMLPPLVSMRVPCIAVRFRGLSRREANEYLSSFSAAVAGDIARMDPSHVGSCGVRDGAVVRRPRKWRVLRADICNVHHLVAFARRGYANRFHRAVAGDVVLQDKRLKIGCRVMLVRNLNDAYVNGSLGTVERFATIGQCMSLIPSKLKVQLPRWHYASLRTSSSQDRHSEQLRTRPGDCVLEHTTNSQEHLNGNGDTAATCETSLTLPTNDSDSLPLVRMDSDGALIAVPWITLPLPGTVHEGFFTGQAVCMPVTPAYAFTVHRIQGVTLDHSILFDASDCFPCDHMVYVAASRVRRFEQLRMINLSPRMITVHKPSLVFSESLPSTTEALLHWRDRRMSNRRGKRLFLPAWKIQST